MRFEARAQKTEQGKRQSRRNAVRHGLTAETVIAALEDSEDYRVFEAVIIADYDAQTAVERELVLRLASLLWHIRRATAIETDLLQIQAEILRDRRPEAQSNVYRLLKTIRPSQGEHWEDGCDQYDARRRSVRSAQRSPRRVRQPIARIDLLLHASRQPWQWLVRTPRAL